jgi:hypothetical protein
MESMEERIRELPAKVGVWGRAGRDARSCALEPRARARGILLRSSCQRGRCATHGRAAGAMHGRRAASSLRHACGCLHLSSRVTGCYGHVQLTACICGSPAPGFAASAAATRSSLRATWLATLKSVRASRKHGAPCCARCLPHSCSCVYTHTHPGARAHRRHPVPAQASYQRRPAAQRHRVCSGRQRVASPGDQWRESESEDGGRKPARHACTLQCMLRTITVPNASLCGSHLRAPCRR